jgi:predicted phage terminase large subunit-like protein
VSALPHYILQPQSKPPVDPIMALSQDYWDSWVARDSLKSFSQRMFPGYISAAHIDQLDAALEWATSTPNARLIVTFPPRHSKSLNVSEHLPAWFIGNHPDKRVIGAAHSASLAYTFSRRVRNKITDYRWPFPNVTIAEDKGAVQAWDIDNHQGGYVAVGVGGSPTGQGGDLIIIDDPIRSAADAESQTVRDALWEWYQGTLRTRLEPGGSIVLTATRWHMDDLTGRLLAAQEAGGEQWRHLHMPAINDAGEALWPERWPVDALDLIKRAVGVRVFEAQYQGHPSPAEGDTLKRDWWKFWTERPALTSFDSLIQSWDMTFRETARGSYVVGQVWGAINADRYLLAQTRLRTDFPGSVAAMRELSADWPLTREKLVENKANGPAIVATLQHEIPGLIEVQPEGGKEARANAVAWQIEAGNVYLPDPKRHPWVADFIEECAAFPNGANDDQVDAMTQALVRMQNSGGQFEAVSADVAAALEGMGL